MRIIAGSLRGRRVQGPGAGNTRIRPTSDRAREALFSILQKWPTGGFLDLFGGTGAVAVEAWSRGYEPVACVEKSLEALAMIGANVQGTGVRVVRKDARKLPEGAFRELAVIFADPPYEDSLARWTELAAGLASWLLPGGVMVWETDHRTELPPSPQWELVDFRHYGAARFHIFKPAER